MAKPRNPRRDTDGEEQESTRRCPACASPDHQVRSRHQLTIARMSDLNTLRAHLTHEYVMLHDGGKQRQDVVDDICGWVAGLMVQYGNLADPDTGAPLPWWEARAQMSARKTAIAEAASARAPEKYQAKAGNISSILKGLRDRQPGEEG